MTVQYNDLTAAMDEAMRACGVRASATVWGITRDSWGQREARSLRLYARDYGRLTPAELESALLGDDLTWEDLDDSEAPGPDDTMTFGGIWDWTPTTQPTKETP